MRICASLAPCQPPQIAFARSPPIYEMASSNQTSHHGHKEFEIVLSATLVTFACRAVALRRRVVFGRNIGGCWKSCEQEATEITTGILDQFSVCSC
jgi:hypothetical protein